MDVPDSDGDGWQTDFFVLNFAFHLWCQTGITVGFLHVLPTDHLSVKQCVLGWDDLRLQTEIDLVNTFCNTFYDNKFVIFYFLWLINVRWLGSIIFIQLSNHKPIFCVAPPLHVIVTGKCPTLHKFIDGCCRLDKGALERSLSIWYIKS